MKIVEEIQSWHRATFPGLPLPSKTRKLVHEAEELELRPLNLEEMADVFIVLMTIIPSWPRLLLAVAAKMKVNRARTWHELPDGTWQHD